ncbi:MAG: CoA pyrophosphatase [Proteobacteria bacterium]|nr:CoA pyrophosphatase [Pseudomonadota bacterium]
MLNRQNITQRLSTAEIGLWGSGMARSDRITRGDNDLNPHMIMPMETKPAAVLVPLVHRDDDITVILTQRTDHLKAHAGQVSFPGGRVEKSDASPEAAALRETQEEIGVPQHRIDLIGQLDIYMTRTGYEVTPVVGFVNPPFSVIPAPFEVADVFEVPLSFLIDPDNHQRMTREDKGTKRQFYTMQYGKHYIWGATAGMLVNLSELLLDQ